MKAFPRDIEIENLNERHIGIESELSVGKDGLNISDALQQAIEKRGLFQSVGYDGGGREFRTNPIRCKSLKQVKGCRYLKEYYDALKAESKVVDSGGTHIHISILNKDRAEMEAHATAMGIAFFHQFQKIAGRDTHWAYRLNAQTLSELNNFLNQRRAEGCHRVYYAKGAILSPTRHKTLEFRGPKGSNDADEILAWVEFLENVIKRANRKNIDGVKFCDLLKGERIESYVKNLTGWRKLTPADLNATLNVNALR